MNPFSLCGALLCVLTAGLLLRQVKPEYAPLLAVAGTLLIGAKLLLAWASGLASLSSLAELYGLNEWLSLLCKALGIAVACGLTADLCRDCGETTLASGAEICGKCAILALTTPLLTRLLSAF